MGPLISATIAKKKDTKKPGTCAVKSFITRINVINVIANRILPCLMAGNRARVLRFGGGASNETEPARRNSAS